MAESRMWRVHPHPETGEVNEQELNKSLIEVGVLLRRAGGAVQILAHREKVQEAEGELPTERYTYSVDFQWLANTSTRPKFEDVPAAVPEPPAVPAEPVLQEVPPAPAAVIEHLTVAETEPDESAIPAGQRG